MKRIFLLLALLIPTITVFSQNYYWVSFTDKNNTDFDPYSYFDDKAIERRVQNNISLYDISDYPLNEDYVKQVSELSEEYVGETRWFNAIAVLADAESIQKIKAFDFVKDVQMIISESIVCEYEYVNDFEKYFEELYQDGILPQLRAMEGEEFVRNNIDGKGVRIAILDGGFPDVDTHDAFAHLRKNQQIKMTYNFPKKQEDVYGWNSHGTMVLSCIAGLDASGNKMGLATGSEFILARTEINSEPAKEEVYWMMAVEWADKNGADVINSSLGYGADRHDPSDMDGKTCLVTRAANMAASKGILVCNAMGNEGDQNSWKTLGAPADADSILSIGGIEQYSGYHINFSSYGPTADGRMKPNVSAFGKADVAKPGNGYDSAYGTSFASPLVAGFVACAWQTNKDLTAMQLKSEVEKSANMYPYYDYAVGFGVPQAGYFTGKTEIQAGKVFELIEEKNGIIIRISNRNLYDKVLVLYHIENSENMLEYYAQNEFWMNSGDEIVIDNEALNGNKTLRVYCEGQIEEYKLKNNSGSDNTEYFEYSDLIETNGQKNIYRKDVLNDKPSAFGVNSKYYIMPYISLGFTMPPDNGSKSIIYGKSKSWAYGLKYINNISKWCKIGLSLDYSKDRYSYEVVTSALNIDKIDAYVQLNNLNFEIFQRFRLVPGTMTGFGTYIDLGVYGNMILKYKDSQITTFTDGDVSEWSFYWKDFYKWNWGIKAKLGHGIIAVYAKYRMTDISNYYPYPTFMNTIDFPNLEAGVELNIPLINN